MAKPKVAFYWCASCGGCEESVVDLAEGIIEFPAGAVVTVCAEDIDLGQELVLGVFDLDPGAFEVEFCLRVVRTTDEPLAPAILAIEELALRP